MLIARTFDQLRAGLAQLGQVSLVPTMGALHEGHLALLAAARAAGGPVAASIFVNPLQFSAAEDLSRYPRDEAGDLAKLEAGGCALVWLPEVGTMYPADGASTITVTGPAARWEGELRPGHFAGVATVVTKLFGQMRPHTAYFGEKDWQQIQVLRRVVRDFLLPVKVQAVPTVREADGLAMSSRNRFLRPAEREVAPLFHATLQHLAGALAAGGAAEADLQRARNYLLEAGMTPDYLALVDALTLEPLVAARPTSRAPARLLAAVRLGAVRLLDNLAVG